MSNSVYSINKNINKAIEFKGLKAQYIWYLGGGLVCLLILFTILYVCGFGLLVCLPVTITLGAFLFMHIYKLSRTYGEHGMMKKVAWRSIPSVIKNDSLVQLKLQLLHAKTI